MIILHEGHRQRLKERFVNEEGLDYFDKHQVLELLLFYSIPYKDTNPIAHELLSKYGSLHGVFEADINDLEKTAGVGKNTAVLLSMIASLSRVYLKDKSLEKECLNSSIKSGDYFKSLFTGRYYEAFYVVCLDSQNKINKTILLQEGTINEAPVYPRLVVENALRYRADSVILAHNHPGGSLKPSRADIDTTSRIKEALQPIGIKVRDHIIVANQEYYSFADEGLI